MSCSKLKKYLINFKEEYTVNFPFITRSKKGSSFAFCLDCGLDFSIAHGGKNDISSHVKSKRHQASAKCHEENKKINSLFVPTDFSVIRAESLVTAFIVEHNLPFSCADHVGPLLRKIFPTSELAKKYGAARTKTTAIMQLMAEEGRNSIVSILQKQPFAVATDGSNDNDKLYPIVVTYFNRETSMVENNVLCMPELNGDATGRNIGNLIVENLNVRNIPLENCIALGCDNANVMIGKKNGVAAVLTEAHKEIIVMGCLCHLIDLATGRGINSLPVSVDELLVDVFYYFKKSSKRKETLKALQEVHGDVKKVLKHVETRWLSMGRCLDRILEQWEPLLKFFELENKSLEKKNARTVSQANLEAYTIPKLKKKKLLSPL